METRAVKVSFKSAPYAAMAGTGHISRIFGRMIGLFIGHYLHGPFPMYRLCPCGTPAISSQYSNMPYCDRADICTVPFKWQAMHDRDQVN